MKQQHATVMVEARVGNRMTGEYGFRISELNGQYRVIAYYPAGEQEFPDCWRFPSFPQALEKFNAVHKAYAGW